MSQKVTKKGSKPREFEQESRYINPLTDFGFKRIFGTESNKDLLIHFLESVLDIDGGIKDLHQSLKNYRDMYLVENELKNEFKKKLEKKDALIRKKNVNLKKLSVDFQKQNSALRNSVRILLEAGISVQKISDSTGLGTSEIEKIRETID